MENEIPNRSQRRAVIYCRVSSREQADEGNSLVSQERLCREYAAKEGYEIAEVYVESGKSAKTAKRKELQRLMDFCSKDKGGVHAMIAYKVDRISRNLIDYNTIKVRLKKCGVEIKSVTEFFEDTPAGRFMENIIANVGQFDNDVRAERCVGGMEEAMLEGRYVWRAPTGYSNAKVNGQSTIVQNERAPLVREVFELISQRTHSTEAIRLKILQKGLVTNYGKPVTKSNFFRLIRNPVYKGTIKKFRQTVKGKFDPIVPEDLFDDVQLALSGRMNKVKHYVRDNPDFPLRRFVTDEHGKQLTGYWAKGRRKKYPFYSFSAPGTTIRKEVLEQKFMDFLGQYAFDTQHLNIMKASLSRHFDVHSACQGGIKEKVQNRIEEVNRQIDLLIRLHSQERIGLAVFTERVQPLEAELDDLKRLARTSTEEKANLPELLRLAAKLLKSPDLLWQKSPIQVQKQVQVFDFPMGVVFDGHKFRTAKVCSLFKLKQLIDENKFPKADLEERGKNTAFGTDSPPSGISPLETKEFWGLVREDLVNLNRIIYKKQLPPGRDLV
ncbi:recombinase family protein [Mucilaginibacter sp. HD30]